MKKYYLDKIEYNIGNVLTLLDRNHLSSTYGCFDRNYWHYKIKDFPSGMSQEFVLILALAYKLPVTSNTFYENSNLIEFIKSGIEYGINSSNKDGSANDYYPYERALGATCFSLYAFTESCLLLNITDGEYLSFFIKRANWIINSKESGLLSNHHAIVALSLFNIFLLTGKEYYKKESEKKINEIIFWQDKEGWYPEYGGCSLGYLSVSIDFLAQYYKKNPKKTLYDSLVKAIDFFYILQHPDGTCGGDYESRNTSIFHPNGFEILSDYNKKAEQIANSYLKAKSQNNLTYTNDDYIFGHSLISNINAYNNCNRNKFDFYNKKQRQNSNVFFKSSSICIYQNKYFWSIFNLKKGGIGKIYKNDELDYSDSGIVLKINDRLFISSIYNLNTDIVENGKGFSIESSFKPYKQYLPKLHIFILFRIFLFIFGRFQFSSQLVRKILQKKLIYNNSKCQLKIKKDILFYPDKVIIKTNILGSLKGFQKAYRASGLVPIYTAVAECFQNTELSHIWKEIDLEKNALSLEEIIS
tara:strand:+ start:15263 stop:16843 length:1581 start_codon:yes stop_codon:yes gene_type:complete